MKKVLTFVVLIGLFLLQTVPAMAVETVATENFETWTNAQVVSGWTSATSGDGGEFSQIYACGQGVSCGGDGTNYKCVYRDATARVPYFYTAIVEAKSNSMNVNGQVDGSYVRVHLQFRDSAGNVLKTSYTDGSDLFPISWNTLQVNGYAPNGTTQVRAILQVVGGAGGGTIFKNFNLYEGPYADSALTTLLVGQNLTRSTEWGDSNIAQGWSSYSHGDGPGDYTKVATGGSSQGISCGGASTNFKQISKTFTASAGYSYDASVEAISNCTNASGVVDHTLVRIYMEFLDSSGNVLATHTMDGKQCGIEPARTYSLRAQAVSPTGTAQVRVTFRVFGCSAGGAIFDNFTLTKY